MQVHSFYRGFSNVPASREIIEMSLMEAFHWTPKQISDMTYKSIQKIFLIRNQKNSVDKIENSRRELEDQMRAVGTGKGKKFYREV